VIALHPITRENWRAALEVAVQPERLHWVASRQPVALMILAKSYVRMDSQVWHPLLIVSDDENVGVVAVGTSSGGEVSACALFASVSLSREAQSDTSHASSWADGRAATNRRTAGRMPGHPLEHR